MRFIIQNDDIFHAHEFRHDALDHLAFSFERLKLLARILLGFPSLESLARSFRNFQSLAQFEGVVVGDHDFGVIQIRQHVLRHDLAAAVIAFEIIRNKNAKTVFNG